MNKIDIAMAAYNGAPYIAEQIESIINQSFTDWRLFIRDDNSTDNTVDIIQRYTQKDSRIILIQDNWGGLGVSRNFETVMKRCLAPYVMLADQDDIWYKDKLKISLEEIRYLEKQYSEEMPILLFSNSTYTDSKAIQCNGNLYPTNFSTDIKDFLFINAGYQGAGMIFNRSLWKILFPFLSNLVVHDLHISLIAHFYGVVKFLPTPLMLYRRHASSASSSNTSLKDRIKAFAKGIPMVYDFRMYNYMFRLFENNKDRMNKDIKFIMSNYFRISKINNRFYRAIECYKYGFKLRSSKLYLFIKILIIPNYTTHK